MDKQKPHAFTWLTLPDLPQPPEHFIERAYKLRERGQQGLEDDVILKYGYNDPEHRKRDIIKNGKVQKGQHQVGYLMGPDWEQWVRENITENFIETCVRSTDSSDPENATELGPHTDGMKLRLFFLIDRGSEDTSTSFYIKPGSLLVVDHEKEPSYPVCPVVNDVDNGVIEVDRGWFPIRQWVLLNSWVLHGVNNIPGSFQRLNFQITVPTSSVVHTVRFT